MPALATLRQDSQAALQPWKGVRPRLSRLVVSGGYVEPWRAIQGSGCGQLLTPTSDGYNGDWSPHDLAGTEREPGLRGASRTSEKMTSG